MVLLVLVFCSGEQGLVTKVSSLILDTLNLRCPRDNIQVELSTARWTPEVYGSRESSRLEFSLQELLA